MPSAAVEPPPMPIETLRTRRPIRVTTRVTLDAPIERVWTEIQKPALLARITRGLIRFVPDDPDGFPPVWANREYAVRLYACGVAPIGRQVIRIERPAAEGRRRFLRDDGRGDLCRRWDHLMTLEPAAGNRTLYVDAVTVEAGLLTPAVAAFAYGYYRMRQRRLKRLAAADFRY